jgi:hydroxypyruvate reductase
VTGAVVTVLRPARHAEGVAALSQSPGWQVVATGHPVPDEGSAAAGSAALELADAGAADGGTLLVCLSGGASAMLAAPAPGLTIADKSAATALLLRAGLPIDELNAIRWHLSSIKAGRLAARAGRSLTLAISDVSQPVDDDPRVIGSGPTVGVEATAADALAVIDRRGLRAALPSPVIDCLTRAVADGSGPAAPGDERLSAAEYHVIASRAAAMRAAADAARQLGYGVTIRDRAVSGEARHAGARLVESAVALSRPHVLIASGETTVAVQGSGAGGRNQEAVVGAVETLAAAGPAAFGSLGTDGLDGPTPAAGAAATHLTAAALGPHARAICHDVLARNDTYPLLDGLGALVRTGPTGTNVGDLMVVLLPARDGR